MKDEAISGLSAGTYLRTKHFAYWVGEGGVITRNPTQIFQNSDGAVQVQGTWTFNGVTQYNAFGKKHLLLTSGGKDLLSKAASIMDKRTSDRSIPGRRAKWDSVTPLHGNYNQTHYTDKAYGASPLSEEVPNTFFVLDGMSRDEITKMLVSCCKNAANGEGVLAAPDGSKRVLQLENLGGPKGGNFFYGMKVSVAFVGGMYHVYHCKGPATENASATATLKGLLGIGL
jgi:hypothetical protein